MEFAVANIFITIKFERWKSNMFEKMDYNSLKPY